MSANSLSRSFASLSIGSVRANVGSSSVASSSRVTLNAALPSSSSRHLSHLSVKRPRVAQDASKNLMRGYASAAPVAPLGLSNLKPAQPTKNSKRKGRGPGSGRGGTATRGHKGQKARRGNGKPTPGFAGGQTPLMRRFPKTGFTNIHARDYAPVNLDKIQHWIDSELLDPSQPIDASYLLHSRCIHQIKDGVKVLGDGAAYLRTPITLIVSRASQSAIQAIEKVGGNVECRYYTDLGLRALVKPHKWAEKGKPLPRDAMPIKKKDLIYYASPNNRGYLAKRAIAATILDQAEKATAVGSEGAPRSAPPPQSTDSGAAETSRKST